MINTAVQDPWLVLYVKRQTEKKVTERLQALGITVYLPTITVVRQWSDRKKSCRFRQYQGCQVSIYDPYINFENRTVIGNTSILLKNPVKDLLNFDLVYTATPHILFNSFNFDTVLTC